MSSPPLRLPRTATADLLQRVGACLESSLVDPSSGSASEPRLVILEPVADHVNVGLVMLPEDPLRALPGIDVPARWWALGVAGRAREWPVGVVQLVARTGETCSVRHTRASAATGGDHRVATWSGLVGDHLRRALGLRTAPPPASTLGLWTSQWLDELVRRGARAHLVGASWRDVAVVHPLVALLERNGGDRQLLRWSVRHLDRAAIQLSRSWTWTTLHATACSGRQLVTGVPPEVASWMDEGLYARMHLAAYPPASEMLDLLNDLLTPGTAAYLNELCATWHAQG